MTTKDIQLQVMLKQLEEVREELENTLNAWRTGWKYKDWINYLNSSKIQEKYLKNSEVV